MKLSIITVNLNNLEGLKKTYESVVCQTFTDYEWLGIDGGSTDGSRECSDQHQDMFPYWCSEPDKGIYNAMNKGIVRAKGEYLNFMNSGDCFASSGTLRKVFDKQLISDIVYGYMQVKQTNKDSYIPLNVKRKFCWYDLYINTLPHQSSFIRRILFEVVGLYDEELKVASDSKWFAMAILNYEATYEFIPYKIAVFDKGGISQTMDFSSERVLQRKGVFPEYVTEQDVKYLYDISVVRSFFVTRILYRLVVMIAYLINLIRNKYLSIKLYNYLNTME